MDHYSSNYTEFKNRWKACTLCDLSQHRRKIVFCRGTVPCNVLYIGEAPGDSEDRLGQPFIGPAGKLLDTIIDLIQLELEEDDLHHRYHYTYALTNVVCCKPPRGEDGNYQDPTKRQVEACSNRLEDFINLSSPELIVCVGRISKRYIDISLPRDFLPDFVEIMHPASILRIQNTGQRSMEIQRCVSRISTQIRKTYGQKEKV